MWSTGNHKSFEIAILIVALLAVTFQVLVSGHVDQVVVIKVFNKLKVRSSDGQPMTELMVDLDMLHSFPPGLQGIVGHEQRIAETALVPLRRAYHTALGIEVSQAMIDPVSFVCKILKAKEEVEGTLQRPPGWHRDQQRTIRPLL